MNIAQVHSELREKGEGHEGAVDHRLASTRLDDFAADDQLISVFQPCSREQIACRVSRGELKGSFDAGALASLPDHLLGGALTCEQAHRVDQDRFSGTGFAGDQGQAVFEFDFQSVDQGEVFNCEKTEHGFSGAACIKSMNGDCWLPDARFMVYERSVSYNQLVVNQADTAQGFVFLIERRGAVLVLPHFGPGRVRVLLDTCSEQRNPRANSPRYSSYFFTGLLGNHRTKSFLLQTGAKAVARVLRSFSPQLQLV